MDYKKIGSVIKKRRNALKITQEQLAEMINKSTVYISLIESGARHPSLETLYCIAMSLKTSVDTIIHDKSSCGDEEHVNEFAFLLADRNEDEIDFIMDIVREMLRHLTNGKISGLRRNGSRASGVYKKRPHKNGNGNGNGNGSRNGNGNGARNGNGNGVRNANGNGGGSRSGNGNGSRNGNGNGSRNGNGNGNVSRNSNGGGNGSGSRNGNGNVSRNGNGGVNGSG